ncbi:uncharacterized protein LOC112050988 [Bicyclus anynana]|uniref:Uncharacterized protein LOC112050988 n=1 Tax=Bicyclus anynana TaxID=110368 RepID=A0A6J1NJL2_BICAN|nr:uncharacterized protein LOC112050988 [Bicyclus anynana]
MHLLIFAIIIQVLLGYTEEAIPEIYIRHLGIDDPSGFTIRWDPIEVKNGTDPIIGIKIKVWRTPCRIRTFNHHVGDQVTRIVKSERLKFNRTTLPDELPELVSIVKPDESSLSVPHVDPEVWYHVRAIAFTATAEGPHSNPIQFKINTADENDKEKSCERIISQTAVADEDIAPTVLIKEKSSYVDF